MGEYTPFVRKQSKSLLLPQSESESSDGDEFEDTNDESVEGEDETASEAANEPLNVTLGKAVKILGTESLSFDVDREQSSFLLRKLPKVENVPDFKCPVTPTKKEKFRKKLKKLKLKPNVLLNGKSPPIENRTFDALSQIKIISATNLKGANRDGTS